jgi:3-hydroxyacyl-CoA dehydrogenase
VAPLRLVPGQVAPYRNGLSRIPERTPVPILPSLPAPADAAARRHLARTRRQVVGLLGPAVPRLPATAALLGASGPGLALAARLQTRGLRVTMIEPDADAARRLTEHLARLGAPVAVSDDPARVAGSGLVIDTSGAPGPGARLSRVAPLVSATTPLIALTDSVQGLDGPDRMVALRWIAPGSGLIEVLGRKQDVNVAGVDPGADPGADPSPDAVAAGLTHALARALARALGCVPLRVPPDAEGAGARLMARLDATAEALIFAGAPAWDLDAAAEAAGFALGPCALMDRLGVDAVLPRRARLTGAGVALPDPGVIARMVAEGRLGRRASVGWFRYPGGGGQVTDPLIEDLVREEAWFARRPMRGFDLQRLGVLLIAALIDESARLLEDGAVSGPGDPDLTAVLALGFPAGLGGPVWLADHWGAGRALAAVEALRADLDGLPGIPDPAGLLQRAARSGRSLTAEWQRL